MLILYYKKILKIKETGKITLNTIDQLLVTMNIKLTCPNSFYKEVFFSQTPGQNGGRVLHEQERQEVGRPRDRVERLQGEHRSLGKHFFQPSEHHVVNGCDVGQTLLLETFRLLREIDSFIV